MKIYDGQTFTTPLDLRGVENVLFTRCEFTGDTGDKEGMLEIRGCANMTIDYCYFHDLVGRGNGIVLGSTGGGSINTRIRRSLFENLPGNAIIPKVGNYGTWIDYNTIRNAGDDDRHHGIYMQAPDGLIEHNDIEGSKGNGISIRSSGIVRSNRIAGTAKSAIRYFSDGMPGPSNELIIEKNYCNGSGEGYAVISLLESVGVGQLVEKYIIRHNTLMPYNEKPFDMSQAFKSKTVEYYGNKIGTRQAVRCDGGMDG